MTKKSRSARRLRAQSRFDLALLVKNEVGSIGRLLRSVSKLAIVMSAAIFLAGPVAAQTVAAAADEARFTDDPREARILELEARILALESAMAQSKPSQPPALATSPPDVPIQTRARAREQNPQTDESIDRLAAERALERTLVRGGALLLPSGAFEIEPSIASAYSDRNQPILIGATGGSIEVAEISLGRLDVNARLSARLGLPAGFQLEAIAGGDWAYEQQRLDFDGSTLDTESRRGVALSDLGVSLARAIYKSESGSFDLIGRVTYNSNVGDETDGQIRFANGFEEVTTSLTALTRQDPLVFVGGLAYTKSLARDGIDPGDAVSVTGSALLAVSPETSLRTGISVSVIDDAVVLDSDLEGSGTVAATLQFGATSVMSRSRLVDVGIEIGLTEDAPSFALSASMPIRMKSLF